MKQCCALILLLILYFPVLAQEDEFSWPSFSPQGEIAQTVGNTRISIIYERPSARNRVIFGGLVPWNTVWRTGAGNCTKFKVDKDVTIGGQSVTAGTYSLLTIPNPDKWIVIINKDTTLYGSYKYDYRKDMARFEVIPQQTPRFYETLNMDMELFQHNAKVFISWEHTQLSFDIETSTNSITEAYIAKELLTWQSTDADAYASAASYLAFLGKDLATALKLAEKAKELDANSEWIGPIKIDIYERLHLYNNALEEISRQITLLKQNKEDRKKEISLMESEYKRIQTLKTN